MRVLATLPGTHFFPKTAPNLLTHSLPRRFDRAAARVGAPQATQLDDAPQPHQSLEDTVHDAPVASVLSELGHHVSRWTLFSFIAASVAATLGIGNGFDSSDPLSVAKALGILTVVVAVHECGHFLAARLQNIHVSKFAIGLGPTILRYQGEVVEYSLRALPLGGFVAFPDDDPDCPYPEDDPNLLRNRPIRDRALVISAGVIANVIFAFTILFAQASTVGITSEVLEPGVVIPKILKDSAADRAGIRPGDVIMEVDGMAAAPEPSTVGKIVDAIGSHAERELPLVVNRRGRSLRISPVPAMGPQGEGLLGVQLLAKRHFTTHVADDFSEAVQMASVEFVRLNGEILDGLRQLVFNFAQSAEQVSGPVAIIAMGAEVARVNAPQLFLFAAVINLNLAIINTLPLPALDGGYFALLVVEALRGGKKLPLEVEQGVTASGLVFLMAVGCFLVVRDTVQLGSL